MVEGDMGRRLTAEEIEEIRNEITPIELIRKQQRSMDLFISAEEAPRPRKGKEEWNKAI